MNEVATIFKGEPVEGETLPPNTNQQAIEAPSIPSGAPTPAPLLPRIAFPLRGHSVNKIVDASQSLLALIARIPDVTEFTNINHLHHDIKAEIESLELELHRAGYDRATILAHRYCLCSAVDEAVMCSQWGQDSDWSERSLLALFHSETWGGEKFFIVLGRLMRDPPRYLELIEFLYLLLCLGFEGKYRVMHNGRTQLEDVIQEVHDAIRKERGDAPEKLTSFRDKVFEKIHFVRRQTPVSFIWLLFIALCALTFTGFYFAIDNYTDNVVTQLQNML